MSFCTICAFFFLSQSSFATGNQRGRFFELSLEELGDVRITSVSKKEERLADAAAAIYVITGDAIRRSGVRSLPEALRLAPNIEVAQITANSYAISIRGFNSNTANKLLVMIDGRTIYTPLYSGVFWDVQDILLEEIDHIEVISGSGGTLWGANAVNGVINVISKPAIANDGDLIRTNVGTMRRGFAAQHSGAFNNDHGSYRVYAKTDQGWHTNRSDGSSAQDSWGRSQLGFRSDWRNLTIQGDAYRGVAEQLSSERQVNTGANLLARWTTSLEDGSELRMQTYFDYTKRIVPASFTESLHTLDLDLQYSTPELEGVQTIWGGGYRLSDDHVDNSLILAFLPADRRLRWSNLFVNHERALSPKLQLTVGTKLETNIYTGTEFLPSLKLAWKPTNDSRLWAGATRNVRAPSRLDVDFYVPGKPPYLLAGGPGFRSEIANTVELGWRAHEGQTWSYTLTLSHSEFKHLRSLDILPSGVFVLGNKIRGQVDALDGWGSYQVTKNLSLDLGLLILQNHFCGPGLARSSPGNDPHAQWRFGSNWNISENQQMSINVRHIGKLPKPEIPAYTSVNASFGWRISRSIDFAIYGRNLFNPHHQEFASTATNLLKNPVQIQRAIGVSLTVRY